MSVGTFFKIEIFGDTFYNAFDFLDDTELPFEFFVSYLNRFQARFKGIFRIFYIVSVGIFMNVWSDAGLVLNNSCISLRMPITKM